MKILLDGYFDHNLGDDLMLTLAAEGLREHELYVPSDKIKLENAEYTTAKNGFDAYVKVIGSGFQIYNNLGIAYRLRDMRRENKYAPIKAVLSCNTENYDGIRERVILKQLKDCDFITARDEQTYLYIKDNIPKVNCEHYPDIVYSMPDTMIPDMSCENALGIAVHNGADFAELAHIADGYVEKTGNKVLLLCFDTGLENDVRAAKEIEANIKHKEKTEIILYENIPDMLAEIKRCSVILGIRFHSIVLAARMRIAFVPMAYSDKTINALGEIGYNGEIYIANNFDGAKALKTVLNPSPFKLDGEIVKNAKKHMIKLNGFFKRQG